MIPGFFILVLVREIETVSGFFNPEINYPNLIILPYSLPSEDIRKHQWRNDGSITFHNKLWRIDT